MSKRSIDAERLLGRLHSLGEIGRDRDLVAGADVLLDVVERITSESPHA
jgi:hypothetical protein